jgi:hypothetical protein
VNATPRRTILEEQDEPLLDAEQRIRQIAHLLWETSGRPAGQSERHWEQARRIFEAERAVFDKQAPTFSVSSDPQSSLSSMPQSRMGADMRNFDELVADAQKALALSLREAFDAGRAHTASELKHRMAALFEDLISGPVAPHSPAAPPAPGHEGQDQQPHSDHPPG